MLIDCDRCGIRGAGCADCLVTALFDAAPVGALGTAEQQAVEVFGRAGFEVEVLAATPAGRRPGRAA